RRRRRAGRHLRADGGRDRARLRSLAARQLRLRAADHGGRLHARLHVGVACRGEHRHLLRGRRYSLPRDGPAPLPTPSPLLHPRAAATDFRTARLLGVRANRVIAFAVLVSGLLAGAVAVLLTVQNPFVQPDFALEDTIVVLVGVVVGGIDRLWTATLGGFAIG